LVKNWGKREEIKMSDEGIESQSHTEEEKRGKIEKTTCNISYDIKKQPKGKSWRKRTTLTPRVADWKNAKKTDEAEV